MRVITDVESTRSAGYYLCRSLIRSFAFRATYGRSTDLRQCKERGLLATRNATRRSAGRNCAGCGRKISLANAMWHSIWIFNQGRLYYHSHAQRASLVALLGFLLLWELLPVIVFTPMMMMN